jgi:hypothetical protein
MAKEKLVGSDGKLVTVTYETAVEGNVGGDDLDTLQGDGTTGSGAGWYEVVSRSDGTSALAAGLSAGDLFWDDGSLVLDDGTGTADSVRFLTEKEQADVASFNLELSRAEIDVTTLSDGVRRYRTGKIDMTGSMEGMTTLGETDAGGWVINNFMRTVNQASAGTVTITEVDDDPIFIKGVLQKDVASGEKEAFFWAKINVLSSSLGARGEDAQSFSANFRIAPGDPEPTYYVREIA